MVLNKAKGIICAVVLLFVGYVAGAYIGVPFVNRGKLSGDIGKAKLYNNATGGYANADAEKLLNDTLYQQEIDRTELLVNRAYNAYINAPESAIDMAQKNYNETLVKVVKTREDYETEISRLKEHIISLKNSVAYYKQSNITPEYIQSIEDNDMEKRKILLQVVEKIVPYGITPGIVSMEVHTIEGLYYILNNGHNVGKKRIAYYIPAPLAVWHPMKEGELQQNEKDSYFTIKNADIIQGTEDVDVNYVTFDEMLGICEANGWTIPYNYIYNKD